MNKETTYPLSLTLGFCALAFFALFWLSDINQAQKENQMPNKEAVDLARKAWRDGYVTCWIESTIKPNPKSLVRDSLEFEQTYLHPLLEK